MSLTCVKMSEDVWLTCTTHALSTETEEIMGLLLGDIEVLFGCWENWRAGRTGKFWILELSPAVSLGRVGVGGGSRGGAVVQPNEGLVLVEMKSVCICGF
ncbi:hypothetical protein CK203_044488 [Vitis vinifera]|uniref:Uncharacterized protein n=1 Tax=Vitis vinifera TaxID=29760 RepID=A0A438HB34_VITVI|nr:hypothetical protein CK203_044488 [Vitis vinifera]